jgi:hypothetical protein
VHEVSSIVKKIILSFLSLLLSTQVLAEKKNRPLLDRNEISIGAGVAINSVGRSDDELGFQFFAAYDLNQINLLEGVNTSVELGYMDYGFSRGNSGGLWFTGVVDGTIKGQLGWLSRLGLDLGDDSGFMLGGGFRYDMTSKAALRGELVIRDDIDSFQLNFVYKL